MAATSTSKKSKNNITECVVCTEIYTDPRTLPCVHNFCFKCIEGFSRKKQPGDSVACPLCRKEFAIPDNGLDALPRNLFLMKMSSQVKDVRGTRDNYGTCEVCSSAKTGSQQALAAKYCVDCDEKLCQTCAELHGNYKMSRSHQQISLDELASQEHERTESSFAACDKHKHEQVKIQCMDCQVTVCPLCYIESHNSHKWSEVSVLIEEFREQMRKDAVCLTQTSDNLRQLLAGVDKEKQNINTQVTNVKHEVCEQAKTIIAKVERDKQMLLDQLTTAEQERMKQVDHLHDDIEQQMSLLEGLEKYTTEIAKKGTSSDIVREAKTLHQRADELMKTNIVEKEFDELGYVEVNFTKSSLASIDNAVGRMSTDVKGENLDAIYYFILFNVMILN